VRGGTGDKTPLFASQSDSNKDKRLFIRSIRRIVKEKLRGINLDNGGLPLIVSDMPL